MAEAEAVRLVIWDLDDTFWQGTLTEGGISQERHFGHVVQALNARGILNAICSKNELEATKRVLEKLSVWQDFIFPSIDWEPKGPRIARIIEQAQVRPETVLFLDDNPTNLREALHFSPTLQTAPAEFAEAMLDDPRFTGKDDSRLTRLAQYKLLEQKQEAQRAADGDVHQFLRESDISVEIVYDIEAHIDRAVELINRTNQLNYTKIRLSEDPATARHELQTQLGQFDVHAGLVRVRDRYGDYGLVGFFSQRKGAGYNQLEHYCFSCRTLGMFVETWLYRQLERPHLQRVGEVLTDLSDEAMPIDWVRDYTPGSQSRHQARKAGGIFMSGGCDLHATCHYLRSVAGNLRLVANTIRHGAEIRRDHSSIVARSVRQPDAADWPFLEQSGYQPEDFTSDFSSPRYSVVVFSFWADAYFSLYQHAGLGCIAPFAPSHLGHANINDFYEHDLQIRGVPSEGLVDFRYVKAVARYIGRTTEDLYKANLQTILDATPQQTTVLLLGMGENFNDPAPYYRQWHCDLNAWSRDVVADFPHARIIYIDSFIMDPSERLGATHYHRSVYQRLAAEIAATYHTTTGIQAASCPISLETLQP